jgi:hypothetical protein
LGARNFVKVIKKEEKYEFWSIGKRNRTRLRQ